MTLPRGILYPSSSKWAYFQLMLLCWDANNTCSKKHRHPHPTAQSPPTTFTTRRWVFRRRLVDLPVAMASPGQSKIYGFQISNFMFHGVYHPWTNMAPEKRWLEDFSGAMLVLERVAAVIVSHVSSLIRSLFLGHSYCHCQFPSHATKNGWLIAFVDAVSFDTEPA